MKKDVEYWKKRLLSVLGDEKENVEKSLREILFPSGRIPWKSRIMLNKVEKARGYPVGTVREWKGKKYKKMTSGKWVQTYEGKDTRGERQAIRNVRRKIAKAETMEDLVEIVSENYQRFQNSDGHILPIVKEFMAAAREHKAGKKKEKPKEKKGRPRIPYAVNDKGFLDIESRNWGFKGDRASYASLRDGVLTIKRANSGTISNAYEESLQELSELYGESFASLGAGGTLSINAEKKERQKEVQENRKETQKIKYTIKESKKDDEETNLYSKIPGLKELEESKAEVALFEKRYKKFVASGKTKEMPPQPTTNPKKVAKKYPAAATYMKANGYVTSSDAQKKAAGQKAKEVLESGGSVDNAKNILKEWRKGTKA